MSESSRRIHQASRQATLAKATLKGLGYTEDDIAWTEVRTIALMLEGVTFVEAVDQASRECVQRLFDLNQSCHQHAAAEPDAGCIVHSPTARSSIRACDL